MAQKSKSSRGRSPRKCPKGTRLLKKPVKEGGKMRYCTKPRKSPTKTPKKSPTKTPKKTWTPQDCIDLCKNGKKKKYCDRKSPPYPASACPGQERMGNDGNLWHTRLYGKSYRWVKSKEGDHQDCKTRCKTLRMFYSDFDPENLGYTYKRKAKGNVKLKVIEAITDAMEGFGRWDNNCVTVQHVKDNEYKLCAEISKGAELRNLAQMGESSEFTAKVRGGFTW